MSLECPGEPSKAAHGHCISLLSWSIPHTHTQRGSVGQPTPSSLRPSLSLVFITSLHHHQRLQHLHPTQITTSSHLPQPEQQYLAPVTSSSGPDSVIKSHIHPFSVCAIQPGHRADALNLAWRSTAAFIVVFRLRMLLP